MVYPRDWLDHGIRDAPPPSPPLPALELQRARAPSLVEDWAGGLEIEFLAAVLAAAVHSDAAPLEDSGWGEDAQALQPLQQPARTLASFAAVCRAWRDGAAHARVPVSGCVPPRMDVVGWLQGHPAAALSFGSPSDNLNVQESMALRNVFFKLMT